MKSKFKKNRVIILIPFLGMLLMSAGGGGKSGGKEPNFETPVSTCETKIIPLNLFYGNIDPSAIQDRNQAWGSFAPVGNILNGLQAVSPTSLYSDIDKSYLHITITATNCAGYGNGGTLMMTWDSTNDGNNNDSAMNIEVPASGSFTVTIDLHEGCGPWYNGSNSYKRAMWVNQATYYSSSVINITNWSLNRVDAC
ncbi:MAG: hypothetical protein ABJL44_14605 [Algibacter sp.]